MSSACLLWLLGLGLATAAQTTLTTTITQGNSRFVLTNTDPTGIPPGSFPFTGEWFVDGRRILTYVSIPANQIDIVNHHHSDSHVRSNQVHAQGQLSHFFDWPDGI